MYRMWVEEGEERRGVGEGRGGEEEGRKRGGGGDGGMREEEGRGRTRKEGMISEEARGAHNLALYAHAWLYTPGPVHYNSI